MAGGHEHDGMSFNGMRHTLMDFAMVTSAIGACTAIIASGGTIAFLDPLIMYAKMYIPDIVGLFGIGDFFNVAAQNAADGTFLSEVALDWSGHGAHGADHGLAGVAAAAEGGLHAAHGSGVGGVLESACSFQDNGGLFADWIASVHEQGAYEDTKQMAEQTYGGMGAMFEAAGHCAHDHLEP